MYSHCTVFVLQALSIVRIKILILNDVIAIPPRKKYMRLTHMKTYRQT